MSTIWQVYKIRHPRRPDAAVPDEEVMGNCLAMYDHSGYYDAGEAAEGAEWHVYFATDVVPKGMSAELPGIAAEMGLPGVVVSGPYEAPKENWHDAWRQYFRPVEITSRTVIVPSWEEHLAAAYERHGRLVLRIEPGMAFGTGTHPTTQLCLKTGERLIRPGSSVLDAGTGSAILAIAAARLGAAKVVGFDLDPDVVENAADNLKLNNVDNGVVQILIEPLDNLPLDLYDVIFCNMLSHEFEPLLPGLAKRLQSFDGRLIVSGLLNEETEAVTALVESREVGLRVVETDTSGEWTLLVCGTP